MKVKIICILGMLFFGCAPICKVQMAKVLRSVQDEGGITMSVIVFEDGKINSYFSDDMPNDYVAVCRNDI